MKPSGLYFVVRTDDAKARAELVKHNTAGKAPHITLAYTGNHLTDRDVRETACALMLDPAAVGMKMNLERAQVSSFQPDGSEQMRHDVLLMVKEVAQVEALREQYLKATYPLKHKQFFMREPHVTVGVHDSLEAAEAHLASVQQALPLCVVVTGIMVK
jgi:hypothetical protein